MRSIRRRGSAATGSSVRRPRRGVRLTVAALVAAIALLGSAVAAEAGPGAGLTGTNLVTTPDTTPLGYAAPSGYSAPANDGLGVPSGAIKHVWVIVMENHAYESNFTGLNDNPYLSQALPKAGAELTNYYGTGHSSLDNYLSMFSGQAPMTDDQADCAAYTNASGSPDMSGGSLGANPNYGQFDSAAGANAPAGDNGCVYPQTVPTLFNQMDAANESWKVYAQDLDAENATGTDSTPGASTTPGQSAGTAYCGAPDQAPGATPTAGQSQNPSTAYPNDSSASAADQYVSKHNPLPWFDSMMDSNDCNATHVGNLFDGSSDNLDSDLQSQSTTPDLSVLIPDNCSNGHDAVCAGTGSATNNLSGMASGATSNQSEGTPLNDVGGSYAEDLFLEHTIPEIMQSPAYLNGGLIAVVWDEAYPQFTYSSDSFADSATASATAFNSLTNDSAGETLYGKSLNWEPSGPNVPNVQSQSGQQLSAGPGFNEYLHRPSTSSVTGTDLSACTSGTAANGYYTLPSGGCYLGGGSAYTGSSITSVSGANSTPSSDIITQSGVSASKLVTPNDEGEQVTLPTNYTGTDADGSTSYYVGQVTSSTPPAAITSTTADTTPADQNPTASFQLVDADGNPVTVNPSMSNQTLTLGSETTANDPLYDAFDPTTGGGDSGALLLSPYIQGGTVSNTYYNHYSLLRSLEDIFNVSAGGGNSAQTGYTGTMNVSTGVDGLGHLGYAAQPGLDPFGTDVFTASPSDDTATVTNTVTAPGQTVTAPGPTVTAAGQTVTGPQRIVTVFAPGTTRRVEVVVVYAPYVKGMSESEARAELKDAGLRVGKIQAPKAKRGYTYVVYATSAGAGRKLDRGAKVDLTLKLKKD